MIKLIQNENELDRSLLLKSLSGRKMLAYMKAYGAGYDFCRFYKITDETGEGFMFIINSTLIICADEKLEATDELKFFVSMNMPFRVEGDTRILRNIADSEDNSYHFQLIGGQWNMIDKNGDTVETFPVFSTLEEDTTERVYNEDTGSNDIGAVGIVGNGAEKSSESRNKSDSKVSAKSTEKATEGVPERSESNPLPLVIGGIAIVGIGGAIMYKKRK